MTKIFLDQDVARLVGSATARLESTLKKVRDEEKAARDRLSVWGDMDHAEVMSKLERIEELEAAANGKLDDDKIEEIAGKRLKAKLAPVERELAKAKKEREEYAAMIEDYRGKETRRMIHDGTRKALTTAKVLPEAFEDALILAERVFEIGEDGQPVTKDGVGVTPGLDPAGWIAEIQERRPHWWPANQGSGSRGSGGGGSFGKNPFSTDHWNLQEQGRILREKGKDYAERMAAAACTKVGGLKPVAAKR